MASECKIHKESNRRIPRRSGYITKVANREKVTERENILPVNVKTDGDDFLISAIVPGIEPEDIDVEILNKTISIRGKFREHDVDEENKVLVSELPFGRFSRVLTLPTKLGSSEAVANLKNGVFTLRVPKVEEERRKEIKVKVD